MLCVECDPATVATLVFIATIRVVMTAGTIAIISVIVAAVTT